MAKFKKRIEAHNLRRQGLSIGAIAQKLSVSKGTVSLWCRDLILTLVQKETILQNAITAGHRGRMMGSETNKKKKLARIEEGRKWSRDNLSCLSTRDLFIAGIALYWAEGSKKDLKVSFVNSEPILVSLMYRWFKEIMSVKREEFMPRIFINSIHKKRASAVLNFWASLLGLPIGQFGNITFLKMKQKKVYENYDNYYGVLALRIRKPSMIRYRILGLIEILKTMSR